MADQRFDRGAAGIFWLKVALIAGVYLLLQLLMLTGSGTGWQKFWVLQPVETFDYWDAIHYANLAVNPACGAFYPLWPALVRSLASPETAAQALRVGIPGSELIFLASLPLALLTFERIVGHRRLALLAFVLYTLGPNAVFQSIGYTESLFGLLSLLFLLCLHKAEQKQGRQGKMLALYIAVFGLSTLLNLVRPALIQSWFAIAFTLGILWLIQHLTPSTQGRREMGSRPLILASLIGAGSLVGYSIFGLFCLRTTGNFFGPFQAQVEWGRTLAFRPWLLVLPRSLLFDLHGLYTPMLVFAALGWVLWGAYRQQQLRLSLPKSPWLYIFLLHPLAFVLVMLGLGRFGQRWLKPLPVQPGAVLQSVGRFSVLYAIAFSGVHSIINFLANSGYLYSTARHYFGTPYAFVAIGALLAAFALPQLNRLAWVAAAAGLLWLGEQWFYYGSGRWLG
ncbi:hypothetical protein [Nodosilinea nodulosa]|uniref:hypothetical protein n=1 Tax=Nodosilinea nodulosa TaxID=416001 RepID=UPI0002F48F97|nr:hypothetical protein [Nodosilinea nodulosa]